MITKKITLQEFRANELRLFPNATNELSSLLIEIGLAAKHINAELNQAGLRDIYGETGKKNVFGDTVKKLDAFANNYLLDLLKNNLSCAGVVSEELQEIVVFNSPKNNDSPYVVMFDPLDGSSNIDSCITVGTIFGIYRRKSEIGKPCTKSDFLQAGNTQVAAGYIIYGSSTMFVYATRRGVNGFTFDSSIGEFRLTHKDIHCPAIGKTFSFNALNLLRYPDAIKNYIYDIQQWNADSTSVYTSRYVGSMVADLHRTLLEGGIFLYPGTNERNEGKLRLMYECNPWAFIFEIAGGIATDGYSRILNIQPQKIHQCCPLFIGSKTLVEELERSLMKNYSYF